MAADPLADYRAAQRQRYAKKQADETQQQEQRATEEKKQAEAIARQDYIRAKYARLLVLNPYNRSCYRLTNFVRRHFIKSTMNPIDIDTPGKFIYRMPLYNINIDPTMMDIDDHTYDSIYQTLANHDIIGYIAIDMSMYSLTNDTIMYVDVLGSHMRLSLSQQRMIAISWNRVNPTTREGQDFDSRMNSDRELVKAYLSYLEQLDDL